MSEDWAAGLREKLSEVTTWPSIYMFKFIVPGDPAKVARAQALFSDVAKVSIKASRGGKYISITGRELMMSPDSVITRYKEAAKIKGLIAL